MDLIADSGIEAPIKGQITNSQAAERWVMELIAEMLTWRQACDVPIPDRSETAIAAQRRTVWTFLSKHGEVIGALKTLRLAGLISDRAYQEFTQRAINTLTPTIVGQVR